MDIGSVSENEINYFRGIARAISEHMCWRHVIDEVLFRQELAPATRDMQETFLHEQVNQVTALLTEMTEAARIFAEAE